MKKGILLVTAICLSSLLTAQTAFEVLRFNQNDILGTARYMGMAGAFGALGGDASSIKDNPAGLGIYRSSEISFSLDVMHQNSNASWYGIPEDDNYTRTTINNFSYIVSAPTWAYRNGKTTGLIYSNFSFTFNRLKSFNRDVAIQGGDSYTSMTDVMADLANSSGMSTTGINYVDDPWLSVLGYDGYLINYDNTEGGWISLLNGGEAVTPSYKLRETGGINNFSIAWSGNYSHRFYIGLGLDINSVDYNSTAYFKESFAEGGRFNLSNTYLASGIGFGFNVGAIYRASDFLRLGLAYHSPIRYTIVEDYYSELVSYDIPIEGSSEVNHPANPGDYARIEYQLRNPMQLNASAAFIIGNKGIVSLEYVFNRFNNSKYFDSDGKTISAFSYENNYIKDYLSSAHTLKVGAEYRVSNTSSLRAGFATVNQAMSEKGADKSIWYDRTDSEYFIQGRTYYATAGYGYRKNNWSFDLAYMYKTFNEKFYPYNPVGLYGEDTFRPASVGSSIHNIVGTLGLRF